MNKHLKSQIKIGIGLIILSIILHILHIIIFKDSHHTMIFLLADVAFVPLEVFFVTMVLDKILEKRENESLMEKVNMLIGLFYNKLGLDLLEIFVKADDIGDLRSTCQVDVKEGLLDFKAAKLAIQGHDHKVNAHYINIDSLKVLLNKHNDFLTNLISNPALLEHDTFSDLLLSVFHLREELDIRSEALDQKVGQFQKEHLEIDINRAYRLIAIEWTDYMKHLKVKYPFLYVTAIMKNPYDVRETAEIEKEFMKYYYEQK